MDKINLYSQSELDLHADYVMLISNIHLAQAPFDGDGTAIASTVYVARATAHAVEICTRQTSHPELFDSHLIATARQNADDLMQAFYERIDDYISGLHDSASARYKDAMKLVSLSGRLIRKGPDIGFMELIENVDFVVELYKKTLNTNYLDDMGMELGRILDAINELLNTYMQIAAIARNARLNAMRDAAAAVEI